MFKNIKYLIWTIRIVIFLSKKLKVNFNIPKKAKLRFYLNISGSNPIKKKFEIKLLKRKNSKPHSGAIE